MDFKQLQSYVSVIKYKSFTTAAEKLDISQPTISTHIRILEEELNTRLITRTAKSFEITPRGWELFECAQNILKLRDDMVNRWHGKEATVIRLGVSTIPSAYILPEVLPGFEKQHGDVSFMVSQDDSQGIIDAVHKGSYDLGLVGMKTENDALVFQQFFQDHMVLITPVNERFLQMKKQTPVPIKELLAEPMILREQGSGSRKSMEHFLNKVGVSVDQLPVTARMNDQESIKNLVAGGLGISIISEKAVQSEMDSKNLLKFALPVELSGRKFYMVHQKEYILKDSVKEFQEYLLGFYHQNHE